MNLCPLICMGMAPPEWGSNFVFLFPSYSSFVPTWCVWWLYFFVLLYFSFNVSRHFYIDLLDSGKYPAWKWDAQVTGGGVGREGGGATNLLQLHCRTVRVQVHLTLHSDGQANVLPSHERSVKVGSKQAISKGFAKATSQNPCHLSPCWLIWMWHIHRKKVWT